MLTLFVVLDLTKVGIGKWFNLGDIISEFWENSLVDPIGEIRLGLSTSTFP